MYFSTLEINNKITDQLYIEEINVDNAVVIKDCMIKTFIFHYVTDIF